MWLTDLEKLADPKYGLTVKFEPGWRTRGASGGTQMKAVQGVLWHHDVAPKSGTYPLRAMLRDGRKGLSGPLCHIGFDRDGVVHVVGAGKANHAGTGKVPGVVRNGGNTRLIGIEMTSTGRGDWTAAQLREMPKLGRALNAIFGLDTSQHWSHKEYSDSGKIDPYGLPGGMAGLRDRIRAARIGGLAGPGGGMSVPRPPAKSAPAIKKVTTTKPTTPKAPAFPLPKGYYYGDASGPKESVSGKHYNSAVKSDVTKDAHGKYRSKGLYAWQKRMKERGWNIAVDGLFGEQTEKIVKQFQKLVGEKVDGKIGPNTWAKAWTYPVK